MAGLAFDVEGDLVVAFRRDDIHVQVHARGVLVVEHLGRVRRQVEQLDEVPILVHLLQHLPAELHVLNRQLAPQLV